MTTGNLVSDSNVSKHIGFFHGRQKSSNLWLGFAKHYFLCNIDFKLPNSYYFQYERNYSNCLLSLFKHILNFYMSNMHSSFNNKKTVLDTLLVYCPEITVLGKMIRRFQIRNIRREGRNDPPDTRSKSWVSCIPYLQWSIRLVSKKRHLCQRWDSNPRPQMWTRILIP